MLAAALSFACMGVCVKLVSDAIPVGEVVFFRSLVATLVAAAIGWREGSALGGVNRRMLVMRGLVGLASMFAYFHAIAALKLGDAVLITHLSPLFVALMSPFVLGARAPATTWLALAIGFAGVWVVAEPGGDLPAAGVASALASAVLAAGAYVSVKFLSRTDSTAAIVLWFSAIATVVSCVTCLFAWVTPNAPQLLALAGVGIFAAIAQILMTRAYAMAEATEVSVYAYATPVFAYSLGHLLLREAPGWRGALGTLLLVLAGVCASVLTRPKKLMPNN